MIVTPPDRARLIAELQATALAIRLFGLRRLPEVMRREGA